MKPMLPVLTSTLPKGEQWIYETKFDGFRAILTLSEDEMLLTSRNGKDLFASFPEIKQWLVSQKAKLAPFLPLQLDGELCSLSSPYKSDFEKMQSRGRLKTKASITIASEKAPCHFCAFDLLMLKGERKLAAEYQERKHALSQLFQKLGWPLAPDPSSPLLIQYVSNTPDADTLFESIRLADGEGIVAKHLTSKWEEGSRTKRWLKYKNYKHAIFYIKGYDEKNSYFQAAVRKEGHLFPVGVFSHGFSSEEKETLIAVIKENTIQKTGSFYQAKEGVLAELQFLSFFSGQLREPSFVRFCFQPEELEGTWEAFQLALAPLHKEAVITHPLKPLWESPLVTKSQYISYLIEAAPFLLPFLRSRALTVIRYPHGIMGELFYQKNVPDYAPDFVTSHEADGINYIVCNDLSTLVWLGNQTAIEFHIPFQTIYTNSPAEVVFDLDPPSRNEFPLAIKAAREIHRITESFGLRAFPKLSGGKGIQIYLPLTEGEFTYEETRVFTSFVAAYLIQKYPESFTIERLKKNRGKKLYVDYIQHGEGKTIICPYSLRGRENAPAAAPLWWDEIESEAYPEQITINQMRQRLSGGTCPFADYFDVKQDSLFRKILDSIQEEV
ncbi:DNA ligase D [Metabacillus sp. GX 13764]|uniref:DNA ligase D n=1 Tax=Metabacillus kandeliae TaxID=2900151 RepID=UPI001E2A37ED|nr:DNA ligase D [Metabacillus kandeliae]MCD7036192.1 DNA ligase D [Metabacillus kandeliae]